MGYHGRLASIVVSGTDSVRPISGPEKETRGAFIDLTWVGQAPVRSPAKPRTFLEDGYEVLLGASAPGARGSEIRFGEAHGRILPAAQAAG